MIKNQTVSQRDGDMISLVGFSSVRIDLNTGIAYGKDGEKLPLSKKGAYTAIPDDGGEHMKFTPEESVDFCQAFLEEQAKIEAKIEHDKRIETARAEYNKLKALVKAANTALITKTLSLEPGDLTSSAEFVAAAKDAKANLDAFEKENADLFSPVGTRKDAIEARSRIILKNLSPEKLAEVAELELQIATAIAESKELEADFSAKKKVYAAAKTDFDTAKELLAPFSLKISELNKKVREIKGEKTSGPRVKSAVGESVMAPGREGTVKKMIWDATFQMLDETGLDAESVRVCEISEAIFTKLGILPTSRGKMTIAEALDFRANEQSEAEAENGQSEANEQSEANKKIEDRLNG